jgi:hypothetical protein
VYGGLGLSRFLEVVTVTIGLALALRALRFWRLRVEIDGGVRIVKEPDPVVRTPV